MAFDRERGVTVQFTFPSFEACVSPETWTWDGNTWLQAGGAMPAPRSQPSLAYDSARHRVVLFAGNGCNSGHDPVDTWEWDGANWQQVAVDGPGKRPGSPGLAYDRARGRVLLFGGAVRADLDSTWAWDGPTYRCETPIAGDINCDGVVDTDDRKIVDAARPRPACAADDTRDLDHDGQITVADRKAVDALCTFPDCARNAEGTDID